MKVGIIGAGRVGTSAAFAMIMRGVGRQIVLVDRNAARTAAEAADLSHAIPFSNPLQVISGGYPDLSDAKIVIITAGASQIPGESRLNLLTRNAAVFQEIIPQVLRYAPEAILLVATNPVDVMTHLTAQFAGEYGVPGNRVIGTGTTLDTARFRTILGAHLGVDPYHVHAYVLGEHGDSEIIPWSPITIGAVPLNEFCSQWEICLGEKERQEIDGQVRNAAYHIIEGKGSTFFGIGSAIARIVEVILNNQRSILTVCTPLEEAAGIKDVTLSLPQLLGGDGILNTLHMPLADEETSQLNQSAKVIKQALTNLTIHAPAG
jgi:L-lactate dehydrogenase